MVVEMGQSPSPKPESHSHVDVAMPSSSDDRSDAEPPNYTRPTTLAVWRNLFPAPLIPSPSIVDVLKNVHKRSESFDNKKHDRDVPLQQQHPQQQQQQQQPLLHGLPTTPLKGRDGMPTPVKLRKNATPDGSNYYMGISEPSNTSSNDILHNNNNNNNIISTLHESLPTTSLLLLSDYELSSTKDSSSSSTTFQKTWNKWQRRFPMLKKVQHMVLRIPPRFRWAFIIFWFGWKIVVGIIMIVMFWNSRASVAAPSTSSTLSLGEVTFANNNNNYNYNNIPITGNDPFSHTRLLYIVTTLSEYNTGTRSTTKGQDRLGEVLIPVLVDSIQSMRQPPFEYQVDVYLICAYSLSSEREEQIRNLLPDGVGLEIWDSATPLGYEPNKQHPEAASILVENTRALARQHRYVIKDKFPYYDMFLAFEDDMRITGHHVQHFLAMSQEIEELYDMAPLTVTTKDLPPHDQLEPYNQTKFYGSMIQSQLARIIPGFVRVEVLLEETKFGAQTNVLPIERDYVFEMEPKTNSNGDASNGDTSTTTTLERHIDPRICCHVQMSPNTGTPETPKADDLVVWETNIKAFSLRQLPPSTNNGSSLSSSSVSSTSNRLLDWLVLMMGPGKRMHAEQQVGGYWSGREGAFGQEPRPSGGVPTLIAQQGGWMLTRKQIARMHNDLCLDSFLPPFNPPTFGGDGQNPMNVEFWSGSYQIFTGVKGGCNMQRVMSMHPDHFSKHLIYHVANNKQRQLDQERMVRADHLFGQLHAVQQMAIRAKEKQQLQEPPPPQ